MKINRSNRLLRGLFITAAIAPSLAFAAVDPSDPSINIIGDDVLIGDVIDDPDSLNPADLIVDPNLQVDVQVTGETLLNGTLTVQPLETTTITPGTPVAGSGIPTSNGIVDPLGTGGPSITAETLIDTTTDSQEVTGGGGATIETNGNTTLTSDTSTTTTVTYGRAVTFEIAQTGNVNPVGDPIDNTEIYYLTDSSGAVVVGAPTFAAADYLIDPDPAASARAALDAYIAGLTPGDIYALDNTLGTEVTAGGAGGNLEVNGNTNLVGGTEDGVTGDSVGGNLAVGGDTVLGDSLNDSTTISGDASIAGNLELGAITDVEQAILDNEAAIDLEEQARIDADDLLQENIALEEQARIDADDLLQDNIDLEEQARIDADDLLQDNIDTVEQDSIDRDDVLQDNIDIVEQDSIDRDDVLQDNIDIVEQDSIDRDVVLQDNIDIVEQDSIDRDVVLQDNIDLEEQARIDADDTLTTNLAQEVADRTALIRQEADGIHIGPNSLITNEVGGVQQLFAQDSGANAINIDVTNGSDLLVNGVSVATDADVDAEEAARIADVDAEEARAIAAEGVLTTNLTNEVTNRIADVNAEEARAIAAEGVLQTNINNEALTRASEDTSIRNDFAAADNAIRSDFERADRRLQSQVDSNRYQIDRNTRGIAMVAAMTNTTIQPGMKQAIDFNMSQFDDATGFGFGYGYRVNENLQINAAGASTTDFEESVVRLGLSYQW